MAAQVIVPAEGGLESCIITKWHKQAGDTVVLGDLLCEAETGKAAVDILSPADGCMLAVLYGEGEQVPTLTPVAYVGQPGEVVEQTAPVSEKSGSRARATPLSSPRAKRAARERGVGLAGLIGSGYGGSIVERDVLRTAPGRVAEEASAVAAPYILNADVCVEPLSQLQKRLDEYGVSGISIGDMVLMAAARALKTVSDGEVDLEFAFKTEGGLKTSVIKSADRLSLLTLSERAKAGQGNGQAEGVFTVYDLSGYSLAQVTPPIREGQIGALGMGRPEIGHDADGEHVQSMTLTLAIDPRAAGIERGATFLKQVCANIEQFELLLVR